MREQSVDFLVGSALVPLKEGVAKASVRSIGMILLLIHIMIQNGVELLEDHAAVEEQHLVLVPVEINQITQLLVKSWIHGWIVMILADQEQTFRGQRSSLKLMN